MQDRLTPKDIQKHRIRVAIDVETTGLDPYMHEIWEIAIIPFDDNYNVMPCQFKARIQPSNPMTIQKEALDVGGITKEELMKIPCNIFQVLHSFYDWKLEMYPEHRFVPVGHNYDGFDKQFLLAKMNYFNYDQNFSRNSFDTKQIANWLCHLGKLSTKSISLSALSKMFKLDELYKSHTSYGDAMTCISLLQIFEGMSK